MIKYTLTLFLIFSLLLMSYLTFMNYKNKTINFFENIFWNFLWFVIILISLRPKFIDNYIELNFNISVFYILTVLSVILLFIFSYLNYIRIKIIEKKFDKAISDRAIEDFEKK